MIQQNPAQIFKAHTRGLAENETHRLHATFNFNEFNDASRHPFGSLTVLNDETLAANKTVERTLFPGTAVMVLPLVGAAECHFSGDMPQIVVPGEAFTYYKHEASTITIRNPYDESLINFLYITFSTNIQAEVLLPKDYLIAQADLTLRNTFHKLFESFQNGLSIHLGIFNSREEVTYNPCNTTANGVFAFVISGAFEVQGRLIEERDGLALWDTPEIDMEALSENAILLLIEAPLSGFNAI
jgi:hypothetical protein